MTFPGSCPWLLIPTQPTRVWACSWGTLPVELLKLFAQAQGEMKSREFSRVGWKVGNFPGWVSFKENRVVFSLWRCISGGFLHPSSVAHYGTVCKLLPKPQCCGCQEESTPGAEKCPAQSHISPRATASCAYKVNKLQRRWQEVKKMKRRKLKKKAKSCLSKARPKHFPCFTPTTGSQNKAGRTVRMSLAHRDICHGQSLVDHRGGAVHRLSQALEPAPPNVCAQCQGLLSAVCLQFVIGSSMK